MSLVKEGDTIQVHYKGTLEDGTEFDNSRSRGDALEFRVGSGQMIDGFDTAVHGMAHGEVKTLTLEPEEAYGPIHPDALQEFPKSAFGDDFEFKVGYLVHGQAPTGQPMVAKIASVEDDTVTLDLNHPLAGKNLTFEIELIKITK